MALWTNCPYCGIRLMLGQACSCEEWRERERELKEKSGFQSLQENIDIRKYTLSEFLSLKPEEVVEYFNNSDYISQVTCERCGNPNARTMTISVSGKRFNLQGFICEICETEFFAKIWPEFIDKN